jgi:hypothetical protein
MVFPTSFKSLRIWSVSPVTPIVPFAVSTIISIMVAVVNTSPVVALPDTTSATLPSKMSSAGMPV